MHFRHSFLKWVGVSVGMLLLLFLFRGVWLQGIANFLVTKENYVPSDVIIVLGGETRGERTARAVELYRKGLAPRILFSDGTSLSWRIRAIDEMVALAKKLGVPEEAIFKEDRSRSTYENAVYTKEILQRNHWNSAIVVTSYWHSHRSKMTFDRVYKGSGISLTYANSGDLLTPNLDRWWEDSERQQVVLTELAKYLVYWIKY
ncbi:YdcF family protein [Thermicanus aegyptius]|uniref:YdcF family protein n=1 Tax=Thermicanus aegyptius TaxID=94009 RepID=UPI00041E1E82|nr:YdcF family protein [Thermicanus aegyptius]